MKKLYFILLLAWLHLAATAQNVVQLEYFIDIDAGVGNNTLVTVTPDDDGDFPFTADLTGVSIGYHKLYIRTKDSDGKWSLTSRRNIQVIPVETANNVVVGEYFFDTDPEAGNGTPITVTPQDIDISQNFTAITSALIPGYHKLYSRTRDAQGNWSQTSRRNIEVPSSEINSVIAAEYFFDTDPGVGNGTPIPVSPQGIDINQSFTATTASLTPGYHKLYIRTLDQQGKWSLTGRRNAEIIISDAPLYVTGVEYSFNTDPGVGSATYISFPTPLTDGTFSFTIPANQVPTGVDTLYMRVKDSTNKNWSLTASKIKYYITSSCPQNIWTGAVSIDWHNPANWSCNQVPVSSTDVIIVNLTPYNCEVLTGNAAVCHKITAVPGSNVKVNTGATLTVSGN